MKIAIFEVTISFGKISVSFSELIEEENLLLESNKALIVGNKLYIKVGNNVNSVSSFFNPEEILGNETFILIDTFNIFNSTIAELIVLNRKIYQFVGNSLFFENRIFKTDKFKKIFGKDFSVFKLS
jgi:hypothetical protein